MKYEGEWTLALDKVPGTNRQVVATIWDNLLKEYRSFLAWYDDDGLWRSSD